MGLLLLSSHPSTIDSYLPAPMVVTNESAGLNGGDHFLPKLKRVYLLSFPFWIFKYISIFEYTSSLLGYSIRIFEALGLAVHCLNCHFSSKIFFKQKLSFNVCDIGASVQHNVESYNMLGHIRIDPTGKNRCLTSLICIISRFEEW